MPEETQGLTIPSYNESGELITTVGPCSDELERPLIRAESRDPHDGTYFTTSGDLWTSVVGEVLQEPIATSSSSSGTETTFQLVNKEVRNVQIFIDGNEMTSGFSVDYSTFDSQMNAAVHFCEGIITFEEPPPGGVLITANYIHADIGMGPALIFDFGEDETNPQISQVMFCDPVHIKDGACFYTGGEFDSILNFQVICPAGYPYTDNNGNLAIATSEVIIANYVINQRLLGDAPMGIYFDVEARSNAMPPGYIVRLIVDKGSATTLKGFARLEINRQRISIR